MTDYFRPIVHIDPARPVGAVTLAGGWCWFDRVEVLARGSAARIIPVSEVPAQVMDRLCIPRAPLAGLGMAAPRLMGILNVTPDSFSDGGRFLESDKAVAHGRAMALAGADILDIGGESTRPGAKEVSVDDEISRIGPVIAQLSAGGTVMSVDTRKAPVARAALASRRSRSSSRWGSRRSRRRPSR